MTTATNGLTVIHATKRGDYFLKYPSEFRPQPGGIQIDPEGGSISPFCWGESFESHPCDVGRGRKFWLRMCDTPHTTPEELNELIDQVAPLAEVVCSGYNTDWNGQNIVGVLTPEAKAALEEARELVASFLPDPSNYADEDVEGWYPDQIEERNYENFVDNILATIGSEDEKDALAYVRACAAKGYTMYPRDDSVAVYYGDTELSESEYHDLNYDICKFYPAED